MLGGVTRRRSEQRHGEEAGMTGVMVGKDGTQAWGGAWRDAGAAAGAPTLAAGVTAARVTAAGVQGLGVGRGVVFGVGAGLPLLRGEGKW